MLIAFPSGSSIENLCLGRLMASSWEATSALCWLPWNRGMGGRCWIWGVEYWVKISNEFYFMSNKSPLWHSLENKAPLDVTFSRRHSCAFFHLETLLSKTWKSISPLTSLPAGRWPRTCSSGWCMAGRSTGGEGRAGRAPGTSLLCSTAAFCLWATFLASPL